METTFTNLLEGTLTAPRCTFKALVLQKEDDADRAAVIAFFLVLFTAVGSGLSQASADQFFIAFLQVIFSIFTSLIFWTVLAYILYATARGLVGKQVAFLKCLSLTGWSHAPLILFPTVYCMQTALGGFVEILIALLLIWFFILNLIAFKIVLDKSYSIILSVFFLTPPVIFMVLTFWLYFLVSYTTLKLLALLI
ncbi:MAG: YIP1 family protein [Candidatus Obscuribacterales bacterium]|nr:YIP1 family protein [Candidatus Obscuribacterales bacterium]